MIHHDVEQAIRSYCSRQASLAVTLDEQPVIGEDFAELYVVRVDTAFYYSESTMHYSPEAYNPQHGSS